ncbi:Ubiquitin-specific protease, partial [Globisporangium splendens]
MMLQRNDSAQQRQPDEYQRYVVPGIQNLGNTCFFNAILQALASVSSFQEYLDEVVCQSALKAHARHIPFTKALHDCIEELAPTMEHEPRPPVVPRRLNAELVYKLAAFRGNKQQDSQELLQFLMNLVSEEQRHCAVRDNGLRDLTSCDEAAFMSKSISDLRHDESVKNHKYWNPLHGLQVNLLQCTKCKRYRPMNNHPFLDVSLSFKSDQGKKPVTLADCLRMYTEPEAIQGVECSYCSVLQELRVAKQAFETTQRQIAREKASFDDVDLEIVQHERKEWIHTMEKALTSSQVIDLEDFDQHIPRVLQDCHKRLQFSRSPDVFCFHFNRKVYLAWSGSARKLDTHVNFPLELDMSAFCEYEQAATEDKALMNGYTSSSSAFHSGKALNGHKQSSPFGSLGLPSFTHPHLIYQLKAVILHQGNERYGHFTAYRRIANGQWFFISDDAVRNATQEEVLKSCAYMLFYERKTRTKHVESTEDDDDSLPDVPFEPRV